MYCNSELYDICRLTNNAESKRCPAFGRHKVHLVDPDVIPDDIRWAEVKQDAGDAMIVFPRVVHYGFNYGCATAKLCATVLNLLSILTNVLRLFQT